MLGNSVDESSPEITVGRIGVSEATGGNLTWLGAAAANTHHPDASRGGRTLALGSPSSERAWGMRSRRSCTQLPAAIGRSA